MSCALNDTMRAGTNTFRIPGDLLSYIYICIRNEFEFISQDFHVCVFISVTRQIHVKSARYVNHFNIDGAQNVSRMCMCTEFAVQVSEQKNAHVSFPVGMVPTHDLKHLVRNYTFGLHTNPPLKKPIFPIFNP